MGKLICIGGGEVPRIKNGIQLPYETKEIDQEIVRIANQKNPKLLFIGTASYDSKEYFQAIQEIFENLGCSVSSLDLVDHEITQCEIREKILNTDIIYIGGGKTRFMLETWKKFGVDQLLLEAYEKGIVCSGLSAGSYCWFQWNYDLIEGLGIIHGINCVHYEQKEQKAKDQIFQVIQEKGLPGYALENCTALEIIDGKEKIIKSNPNKNAYKIIYEDGQFRQIGYEN